LGSPIHWPSPPKHLSAPSFVALFARLSFSPLPSVVFFPIDFASPPIILHIQHPCMPARLHQKPNREIGATGWSKGRQIHWRCGKLLQPLDAISNIPDMSRGGLYVCTCMHAYRYVQTTVASLPQAKNVANIPNGQQSYISRWPKHESKVASATLNLGLRATQLFVVIKVNRAKYQSVRFVFALSNPPFPPHGPPHPIFRPSR